MMRTFAIGTTMFVTALAVGLSVGRLPAQTVAGTEGGLHYNDATRSPVPIPSAERNLQTVVARPFVKVTDAPVVLEGPSFERSGDLVFSDATDGRVLRLSKNGEVSIVASMEGVGPGGIAIHRDGRIYVAVTADRYTRGWIVAMQPDGSERQMIVPPEAGYVPNDLAFDQKGGFYFTDFRGSSTETTGGVYYVSADANRVSPILLNVALANGVALSGDGKTLWVTEHGRNALHRIRLSDATTVAPLGTAIAYTFIGPAPDSMRIDSDGNLYVALMGQGRVLVLGRNGVPIGQILIPDRDEGHHLDTASLALDPDGRRLLVVAGDRNGDRGAQIYQSEGYAPPSAPFWRQ